MLVTRQKASVYLINHGVLGMSNHSETSLGTRKGPKATYFHPRTHPEGYPGGFGVFRGTWWNLEPCFKKGARTWYPPKVPSPGQKFFFF